MATMTKLWTSSPIGGTRSSASAAAVTARRALSSCRGLGASRVFGRPHHVAARHVRGRPGAPTSRGPLLCRASIEDDVWTQAIEENNAKMESGSFSVFPRRAGPRSDEELAQWCVPQPPGEAGRPLEDSWRGRALSLRGAARRRRLCTQERGDGGRATEYDGASADVRPAARGGGLRQALHDHRVHRGRHGAPARAGATGPALPRARRLHRHPAPFPGNLRVRRAGQ
eukprot:scaffold813_cov313-Prasinococcus_capsulatus_cf.AAC.2